MLRLFVISFRVCPWQAFTVNLMFVVRKGACPKVEHLKSASLGLAPALPANIRPGFKGLPGTNALAYYEKS
jgi:hypothetical protein